MKNCNKGRKYYLNITFKKCSMLIPMMSVQKPEIRRIAYFQEYTDWYTYGGFMTGKFLKKLMSAAMCIALGAGVFYSGNELAASLSATVFAEEISESENESTYVATISKTILSKRLANPTPANVVREKLNRLDVMNKIMVNVEVVDPVGKTAVVVTDDEAPIDVYMAADEASEIVGRFCSNGSGVVEEKGETWTKLSSGDVSGYVKTAHVIFDDEALTFIEENGEKNDEGVCVLPQAVSIEEIRAKERAEALAKEESLKNEAQNQGAGEVATGQSGSAASESYLLACIVYCESGNQSYEGQLAVANVVLNRVKSPLFPNTVSEVVYQRGQFTPAFSGSLARVLKSGPSAQSVQAANDALAGNNNIGDYLYFNGYVDTSRVNSYVVIGDHTFYN